MSLNVERCCVKCHIYFALEGANTGGCVLLIPALLHSPPVKRFPHCNSRIKRYIQVTLSHLLNICMMSWMKCAISSVTFEDAPSWRLECKLCRAQDLLRRLCQMSFLCRSEIVDPLIGHCERRIQNAGRVLICFRENELYHLCGRS